MARQRVSDLWGGTAKDWSEYVTKSLILRAVLVLVAIPLSVIGFAIADNPQCPSAARLLIAPGYVLALHLPIYSGRFLNDIGRFAMTAVIVNFAYYMFLLLGATCVWDLTKDIGGESVR